MKQLDVGGMIKASNWSRLTEKYMRCTAGMVKSTVTAVNAQESF